MERPRLVKASAFRHTPAGTAGRRHQNDFAFRMQAAVDFQNGLEHRCLAGAGRTGDNGQAVAVSRVDRCLLFGRQHQPHFTLDLLQRLLNALRRRRLYQPHGNTPGRFIFLCECAGQVDVIFDGYHLAMKDHVLKHIRNLLLVKPERREGDLCIEQPKSLLPQSFTWQEQMSFAALAVLQRPEQCAFDPHGVMQVAAVFLNDGIYPEKSKTGYLAQLKGTLFQNVHTGRPEVLVDLQGRFRRDLEWGEQRHQVLEHPALRIRGFDVLQLAFRNALDLQQPLGMVLQNIQRFHAKPGDDLRGSRRPNAFDEAGGQIAFHAVLGLGNDLAPLFHLKLHTIFALCPFAVQFQLYRVRAGQFIARRNKADQVVLVSAGGTGLLGHLLISGLYADDAEPVYGVMVDRPVISSSMDHFFFPSFYAASASLLTVKRRCTETVTYCS